MESAPKLKLISFGYRKCSILSLTVLAGSLTCRYLLLREVIDWRTKERKRHTMILRTKEAALEARNGNFASLRHGWSPGNEAAVLPCDCWHRQRSDTC